MIVTTRIGPHVILVNSSGALNTTIGDKMENNYELIGHLDECCLYCEYLKEYGFNATYVIYCDWHPDKRNVTENELYTIPNWCPSRNRCENV